MWRCRRAAAPAKERAGYALAKQNPAASLVALVRKRHIDKDKALLRRTVKFEMLLGGLVVDVRRLGKESNVMVRGIPSP